MRIIIRFFFFIAFLPAVAQQNNDDALARRLMEPDDGRLLQVADSLFRYGESLPYEKSVAFFGNAIDVAAKTGNINALAYCYFNRGIYYSEKGKYGPGHTDLLSAYRITDKISPSRHAQAALHLAKFYVTLHMIPEAKERGSEALAIIENEDPQNYLILFRTLYFRGVVAFSEKDYDTAIIASKKSIQQFERVDNPTPDDRNQYVSAFNTIGLAYNFLNQTDSSLKWFDRGMKTAEKLNMIVWSGIIRWSRAGVYLKNQQLQKAVDESTYAYHIAKATAQHTEAVSIAALTAEIYIRMKRYDLAKIYLDSAKQLFSYRDVRVDAQFNYLKKKGRLSELQGNTSEAFQALKTYSSLRDSIEVMMEKDNLSKQATSTFIRAKDSEIKLLRFNNEVIMLEASRKNLQRNALIGVLFLSLLVLITVFANLRNKKRVNDQLLERNRIIEQQREELTVSLENLNVAQAQLVQAEKMVSLGQLTAGIAHEINNPLNFISGGVDALRSTLEEWEQIARHPDRYTAAQVDEFKSDADALLGVILSGVSRISKIISSLRTFSGPQRYEKQAVNVNDTIDVSVTILTSKIKNENIKIVKNYGTVPLVAANEAQLSQVFLNLIDNAIYSLSKVAEPRTITLTTEKRNNQIRVSIADNGGGIPSSLKNKIMDPFFTTKEVGVGTGLGLSISLGIINNHQGSLTVESEEGKGATFIVNLPDTPYEPEQIQ